MLPDLDPFGRELGSQARRDGEVVECIGHSNVDEVAVGSDGGGILEDPREGNGVEHPAHSHVHLSQGDQTRRLNLHIPRVIVDPQDIGQKSARVPQDRVELVED